LNIINKFIFLICLFNLLKMYYNSIIKGKLYKKCIQVNGISNFFVQAAQPVFCQKTGLLCNMGVCVYWLCCISKVNNMCLDHNIVHSVALAASVKLLLNGNLISLTCDLVDPLCERGTILGLQKLLSAIFQTLLIATILNFLSPSFLPSFKKSRCRQRKRRRMCWGNKRPCQVLLPQCCRICSGRWPHRPSKYFSSRRLQGGMRVCAHIAMPEPWSMSQFLCQCWYWY